MTLTADTAGRARSPGLSYQELLDTDSRPVPDVLRWQSLAIPSAATTSPSTATSPGRSTSWRRSGSGAKVWQMACREEEHPRGRRHARLRHLRLRSSSCRRPRPRSRPSTTPASTAAASCGSCRRPATELRCPFHGYAWNLDGSLKQVPVPVGLPARRSRRGVPPARGARSAPGAASCSSTWTRTRSRSSPSSAISPKHFERWPLEKRYKQAHVAKILADQLEDGAGGLHGGLPRRGDAPAAARRHRRRQQPVRHVGQLQPRHHTERHAEPAPRSGRRPSRRCSTR